MSKIILFIVVSLVANLSFAQGPGWTDWSDVEQIIVTANGGINVRLNPELSGCVSQGGYGAQTASIYPDHPGLELFQSNLLAASMSGKKVRLYFIDDTCRVTEMRFDEHP